MSKPTHYRINGIPSTIPSPVPPDEDTVLVDFAELHSVDVDLSDLDGSEGIADVAPEDVEEIRNLIEKQWPGFWAAYEAKQVETLPAEVLPTNEEDRDDA